MEGKDDVEGRPMVGPLPVELQQMKAEEAAVAALAARRKSEDVKSTERNILKIRRRSFGESSISPEDAATRRSSRAIKRRKFDDEISEAAKQLVLNISPAPGPPTPGPSAPSSAESRSRNGFILYKDLWTPPPLLYAILPKKLS